MTSVWAPLADTLELLIVDTRHGWDGECDIERIEMEAGENGVFTGPELRHGQDYGFSVNGGPLLPDPKSSFQPFGVHGPSRYIDESTFELSPFEGKDARGAVMYEMHVGTFTEEGTLDSAIGRLDHLAETGIDIVELLPIAPFPGNRGWGYDGVSWTAVHEAYGGPEALLRFVNACHERGMGVCLDVVYNHLGPDGNYLPQFAPYFTDKYNTPWGSAINLDDDGSEGVREHIVSSALRWFTTFGVDALRLDAVHAMIDESERHVLADLSDAVHAYADEVGRPLRLIAESDLNDPIVITPTSEGGWGCDMQWADDVHHALRVRMTSEKHGYYADFAEEGALAKVMSSVFFHDGIHSTFRASTWGAPVPDQIDGHSFVVYDQNHDQVGNRAVGDRPSEHLTETRTVASLALILASPFTPMLFQGQEWASQGRFQFFTDHSEFLGPAVSAGRLAEFSTHGWEEIYGKAPDVPDPQALSTFENSKVNWQELADNNMTAAFIRRLIRARKTYFADADRANTRYVEETPGQIILHRPKAILAINLSDEVMEIDGEPALLWGSDEGGLHPASIAIIPRD